MSVRQFVFQVGKAALKSGANLLLPGSGVAVEVAAEVIEERREQNRIDELRADMEAAMAVSREEFRQEVQAAVADLRSETDGEVDDHLEGYLLQLQSSIERGARFQGDPSAKTVPNTVNITEPVELASFLPERPPRFQPGDHVPGRPSWRLEELLGVGGFGEVWKARHDMMGDVTAFKFFLDPKARKRFTAHEVKVISQIKQQGELTGIVNLLDAEPEGDPPWMQFEYADGGDLTNLMAEYQQLTPADRTTQILALLQTLAARVGYFHTLQPAIVHRDLKPANILLKDEQPLIADFGIGVILEQEITETIRKTQVSGQFTTIQAFSALYASPQQKKGRKPDVRDDVYALGVIGYQMLRQDWTLECPTGEGWKRVLKKQGVPEKALTLLARCWDGEVEERPENAVELAEELAKLSPSQPETKETQAPVESATPQVETSEFNKGIFKPEPQRPTEGFADGIPAQPKLSRPQVVEGTTAGEPLTIEELGMKFCWCPPGSFKMGSPKREFVRCKDEKQVNVTLTEGFWMGTCTVTQSQWNMVMGKQSRAGKAFLREGDNYPATYLSWNAASEFCWRVTETGRKEEWLAWDWECAIPSEAQWEYACRAGTTTAYGFGNRPAKLGLYAWYHQNAWVLREQFPHEVGLKTPNNWGMFDMHGNVWEWCQDWYASSLPGGNNPVVSMQSTSGRVYRGGGIADSDQHCRSANRSYFSPVAGNFNIGLRVALSSTR